MKNKKRVLALLMAGVLTFGCFPVTAGAVNNAKDGTKPANGTTTEQPFPKTLLLSEHNASTGFTRFRIPALTTASDGTLIAATDLRWDNCGDGGGIDTLVSKSTDNGANWSYTVANYLGDNGNMKNVDSTAFIDASLVTKGDTVYMACDLYPAGVALNSARYSPQTGSTGYDTNGNLLLAAATDSVNGASNSANRKNASFSYYLEKKSDATADSCYEIKDSTGVAVTGYTIDDHFNIKSVEGAATAVDTNLFCGDSPYFPYPTDFIYIVKSTDNGATWSAPQLADVKKASEQTILVGPGRGLVTSTGRIMFTCYEFTSGDKNSATIYSDDNGATWHRGASVSALSSEAVMAEADGRVYMFVRKQNVYYVSEDNGTTWSAPKSMGITYNNNCQLTAITYSKKVNGKTAILFAGPSDTSGRNSGRIWLGLVQEDGSIQWQDNPYVVNNGTHYAYSCMTELANGEIGLLYEYDDEKLQFDKISFSDIAPTATTGGLWLTNDKNAVVSSAVMKSGETASYAVNTLTEGADITVSSSNRAVLEASYADGKLTLKSRDNVTGLKQVKVTVTAGEETVVMDVTVTDAENYQVISLAKDETKTVTVKGTNYGNADTSSVDTAVANVTVTGKDVQDTYEKSQAQLGTAIAAFEGKKVDLDKCLYTLEAGSGSNTYKVKAMNTSGTAIYLGPKAATSSGLPNVTASQPLITFAKNDSDATFSLMDNSTGGAGKYLYFHHTNASKLHFDRQNTADDNCYFEIYTPSESASDYDLINGYKKVESLDELEVGGNYLIVTKADTNGNHYVLIPSTGTEKYNHVAKLVKESVTANETAILPATGTASFNSDSKRAVSDALYTFKKVSGDNSYVISGNAADGSTTFLNLATAQIPNKNAVETIELKEGSNGTIGFYGTTSSRYLYFWRDTNKLYYDRNSTLDATACVFELYKASADAPADSPIAGFEKINGLSAVEDGGEYLIAAKVGDSYYVMNPTLEGTNYKHVAKVSNETYVNPAATAGTTITFTGVANGNTSVQIGDVVYYVIVAEDGVECSHKTTVVLDAKDATCTEPGSTGEVVCVDCGAVVQEATEIAAKGHTFGEWVTVKEPTTTEEGSKERICSVCQTKETETIAKLPDTEKPDQPATPSAPENVTGSEVTKDSIKITWDAPASTEGIAGYKIYVNGAVYATDISKDAVGYTLSGLKAGETYEIQVVAVGTDENATEYAAAVLSVTTKSEDKNDNNGGNDNNGNNSGNINNGGNDNNGNAGNNKPSDNKNTATTDKNQNTTVNKAAKTGDTANVVFPAAVMMLAGAAVAGILFRRKWMK